MTPRPQRSRALPPRHPRVLRQAQDERFFDRLGQNDPDINGTHLQQLTSQRMESASITLGILAGGRATRLSGVDKAWLLCDGMPQVLRLVQWSSPQVGDVWVSANRNLDRYVVAGLRVAVDRLADIGPLGGIEALAAICSTPWLLTLPVDVVHLDNGLLSRLSEAGPEGAVAQDRDGLQPLIALWPMPALRRVLPDALEARDYSVQSLQRRMDMPTVVFADVRFGNLNRPDDCVAAGMTVGSAAA